MPEPRLGLAGPSGLKEDRKPAFGSAASSVAGLAATIESKVARVGAAWLTTDGSTAGNAAAWRAVLAAGRKMAGWDGQGGLLVLADVQQVVDAPPAAAAAAVNGQEQQPEELVEAAADVAGSPSDPEQQQPEQQQAEQQQKAQAGVGAGRHSLQLLLMRDDEVSRSVMQVRAAAVPACCAVQQRSGAGVQLYAQTGQQECTTNNPRL